MHVISLESKPANVEGHGQIAIRDLVRNALRMRPDRIIVGEVRGGEALDMLQAMNTGHDGSMSTLHANNAHDAMTRLETLVLLAGTELPSAVIAGQSSPAILTCPGWPMSTIGSVRIACCPIMFSAPERSTGSRRRASACIRRGRAAPIPPTPRTSSTIAWTRGLKPSRAASAAPTAAAAMNAAKNARVRISTTTRAPATISQNQKPGIGANCRASAAAVGTISLRVASP